MTASGYAFPVRHSHEGLGPIMREVCEEADREELLERYATARARADRMREDRYLRLRRSWSSR